MNSGQWTRRQWLQGAGMTLAAAALHAQTPQHDLWHGEDHNGSVAILGIPFAEPPVGPLRFKAPQPLTENKPNLGHFAPAAMQPGRQNVSEDCLYLNVYAPKPTPTPQKLWPVFVWIHGGGFTGGSPNDTDGSVYAREGIVVVTVAYRLGVFGFLDWSALLGPQYADSANNGVRDVVAALKWVNANIANFGGDPARVTIGGESAGAKMVASLMAVEEARPLFQSMISESGGGERVQDAARSAAVAKVLGQQLKAPNADAILAMPAAALIDAQQAMTAAWPMNFPMKVESGGALLPKRIVPAIAAGNTRGKRLLIGTNRDENALYLGEHAAEHITAKRLAVTTGAQFDAVLAQYAKVYPEMNAADRNIRALTAEEYWVPSIRVAEAHNNAGGSTWFYRLDEPAASGSHKGYSYHSYDLGFVWNTLSSEETAPAQKLGLQMRAAWASFIKGETPAAQGLPTWPQWNPQERATMLLDATSRIETKPFEAELHLWDSYRFA